jgi:hypothetical protein
MKGDGKTDEKNCLKGAEEILGVVKGNNNYFLNWPIEIITTESYKSIR